MRRITTTLLTVVTVILMSNSCTKSVLDVLPEDETIEIGESTQTGDESDGTDDSTNTGDNTNDNVGDNTGSDLGDTGDGTNTGDTGETGNDGDGEDDGTIDIVIDDPEVGEDIIITF